MSSKTEIVHTLADALTLINKNAVIDFPKENN